VEGERANEKDGERERERQILGPYHPYWTTNDRACYICIEASTSLFCTILSNAVTSPSFWDTRQS